MHLVVLTQVLDRDDAVLGFFHGWCEAFARHASRLTVLAQRVGSVDLPPQVQVHSLGKERGAGRLAMLARLWSRLLRLRERPDAVFVHMVPRLLLVAAPALWVRRPRVPLYLWYTHKGVDRNLRLAVPLTRAVFTASAESFRLASGRSRAVVTGHGIDCEHFRPAAEARSVDVLCVARLAPSKGQDELLEALEGMDPVPLTQIAGGVLLDRDRVFRDDLQARARERLGDRVTLLGAVPWTGIADVMRRARVLVNTSRTGSVDKVVLEAMACGTVPLTCNEAFGDVFGPALAERLMYPRGRPDILAQRLAALLTLPRDEREFMEAALRARVLEQHDLHALVPRMVARMETGR